MWHLQKNLSYKNPVLACCKNLVNGSTNMSKLNWHWTNEVAAAISAGLISVCRSSCQEASQWKGGFDILDVKAGFDILVVFFSLRQAEWAVLREKVCQLLPAVAQITAHPQALSLSSPSERAPAAGALQTEREPSITAFICREGKEGWLTESFRKYPIFSSVKINKRDTQQIVSLSSDNLTFPIGLRDCRFHASLEFLEYIRMKWT